MEIGGLEIGYIPWHGRDEEEVGEGDTVERERERRGQSALRLLLCRGDLSLFRGCDTLNGVVAQLHNCRHLRQPHLMKHFDSPFVPCNYLICLLFVEHRFCLERAVLISISPLCFSL